MKRVVDAAMVARAELAIAKTASAMIAARKTLPVVVEPVVNVAAVAKTAYAIVKIANVVIAAANNVF